MTTASVSGIMITDGGPHPADKWAAATAEQVITVADSVVGDKRAAALRLQADVTDLLEGHHHAVQQGERLAKFDLTAPLEADEHVEVDEIIADIQAMAAKTPWADHFALPETVTYLRDLLSQHFRTSMAIERGWAADGKAVAPVEV